MAVETVNETGLALPNSVLRETASHVMRAMDEWRPVDRNGSMSMFTRGTFHQPRTALQAIHAARNAMHDDVVGNALELLEGISLDTVSWESSDQEVAAAWNRSAAEIDLDWFVRAALRELNTLGRMTVATWWGTTEARPAGTGPAGKRARRRVSRVMPQRLVILPAEKVFRIASFWGVDKLLWLATQEEHDALVAGLDPTSDRLILGSYPVPVDLNADIIALGGDPERCWLLDPRSVWQYRLPGEDYGTGTATPMARVLPWLEQKARLMDADRASLIGAANFVLVFKIGTDLAPGQQEEITAYREGMTKIAKMPVIVGDHRLNVEILAPDTAAVLNADKHAVVNNRIAATVLGLPDDDMLPGSGRLDPEVAARMMVARAKSRRRMLQRALEANLGRVGSKLNGDEFLEKVPSLAFTPREIPLVGVTAAMNAVLAARQRNDLSRQSYLEGLGYDQDVERVRREREADEGFDDTFQTHEPFDSPGGGNTNNNGGDTNGGGRPLGAKSTDTGEGNKS